MLIDYVDDLPEDIFRALNVVEDPIKANELAKDYLSADDEGRGYIHTFFANPCIQDYIEYKEQERL